MNEHTKYYVWIRDTHTSDGKGQLSREAAMRIVFELREAGYLAVALPLDFSPPPTSHALSHEEWRSIFG